MRSALERTVHDDSRPAIEAICGLLGSKPARSERDVSVVDDLKAESLVERALPGHVSVRGQRQCLEAVLSCPRCRGLDRCAPQTLSGGAGMDRDLVDMRAGVNHLHQQVGHRLICVTGGHPPPAGRRRRLSRRSRAPRRRRWRPCRARGGSIRPRARARAAFPAGHCVRLGSDLDAAIVAWPQAESARSLGVREELNDLRCSAQPHHLGAGRVLLDRAPQRGQRAVSPARHPPPEVKPLV